SELQHLKIPDIGEPDVTRAVDAQAVGRFEILIAPGTHELAVALEDEHRVLAAVADVDAVARVGRYCGDRAERNVIGQLRPSGDRLIVGQWACRPCWLGGRAAQQRRNSDQSRWTEALHGLVLLPRIFAADGNPMNGNAISETSKR